MTRLLNRHRRSVDDIPSTRTNALVVVLWPLAIMVMANLIFRSYFEVRANVDFLALYGGAQRLVEGVPVYAVPNFLLTPSGLLAMAPFGLLPRDMGFIIWNTLSVVAALVGVALSVRFVGGRLLGPLTAAVVLGFALTESLTLTLLYGNLNNTLLLALGAGFVLAESRDRHVGAGVLLGLALALKPLFVLVLLVPLLRRGWSTLAWAIAIPGLLNIIGLFVVPQPSDFFSVTVPNLLHARPGINSSLWAVGNFFDAPEILIGAGRLLVLVLAVAAVWRLRHLADRVVRVGISYGILLTATLLVPSLSQAYYSMTLLPALLLVAAPHDSPMRNPLAWFAVYGFFALDQWVLADQARVTHAIAFSRPTIAWTLLFLVMVVWAMRYPATRRYPRDLSQRPTKSGDSQNSF